MKISTFLFCILIPALVYGQVENKEKNNLKKAESFLNIYIDSIGREVPFYEMGVNTERMFYRSLDGNGEMPSEILDDILSAEDLIYRWPGGATANFYHFFDGTSKGYGLVREEVDEQDHPMKCNNPKGSEYCMSFEQTTPRNYIYDLLDFADIYQEKFHKKKKVLWLPNIFTFYLHNKSEIPLLKQFNTFDDVIQAKEQGIITEDFYRRIKDVVDVYDILRLHPSVDLEGIEYGNELFYHEPATGVKYNQVNNGLLWLLNNKEYTEKVQAHISLYKTIVEFCNRLLFSRGEKIPTAVPTPYINFLGGQPNMNRLWNEGIRDSILDAVDGVIYHFYFKADSGPRVDQWKVEESGQANNLKTIKSVADDFMNERIPKVIQQYDSFFGLTAKGKKVWMTEFNTDHIKNTGYFSDWQNTFFHAATQFEAFIAFIETDLVKYAFPHLWVSHINDFDYGAYAAKTELDGSYQKVKRTTFSTYSILGKLAQKKIMRIKADLSNKLDLQRYDFYIKTYFEPSQNTEANELGNLIIAFTNKSGTPISFIPSEDFIIQSNEYATALSNGYASYLDAPHIYSSNGRIINHETINDFNEEIQIKDISAIDINSEFVLPGYAVGYLSFPINRTDSVFVLNYSAKDALGDIIGETHQIVAKGKSGTEVRAIPKENYQFEKWSDGRIDNPRTDVNVTKDLNIQAIFIEHEEKVLFDLIYTSGEGGHLQGDSTQQVEEGKDGTPIEAIPDANYYFDGWSDGRTDNPRTDLNIVENISVQAIFSIITKTTDYLFKHLKVYPNPTQDIVNIEWDNALSVRYTVYLTSGQKITSGHLSEGINTIHLNHIPSGTFFIKLESKKESTMINLIKY